MKPEERAVQAIKNSLQALCSRVKALIPTVICNIGDTSVNDSLQIYVSFLKTIQSDTLDLCVVLKWTGIDIVAYADLVQGGSGSVFSELAPIILSKPAETDELEIFLDRIRKYILSQEGRIIQEML